MQLLGTCVLVNLPVLAAWYGHWLTSPCVSPWRGVKSITSSWRVFPTSSSSPNTYTKHTSKNTVTWCKKYSIKGQPSRKGENLINHMLGDVGQIGDIKTRCCISICFYGPLYVQVVRRSVLPSLQLPSGIGLLFNCCFGLFSPQVRSGRILWYSCQS